VRSRQRQEERLEVGRVGDRSNRQQLASEQDGDVARDLLDLAEDVRADQDRVIAG